MLRLSGSEVFRVVAKEGDDVILPCNFSSKLDLEKNCFRWMQVGQNDDGQKVVFYYEAGIHSNNGHMSQDKQFKGRVSHFPDQLKNGNALIMIRNTGMADNGNYACDFPWLQPNREIRIELIVGECFLVRCETGTPLPLLVTPNQPALLGFSFPSPVHMSGFAEPHTSCTRVGRRRARCTSKMQDFIH